MKILHCKDLVTGCGEIFRGESEEDVLEKAAEHSKNVHQRSQQEIVAVLSSRCARFVPLPLRIIERATSNVKHGVQAADTAEGG